MSGAVNLVQEIDVCVYSETSEDYLAWRNEMMNVEVNA